MRTRYSTFQPLLLALALLLAASPALAEGALTGQLKAPDGLALDGSTTARLDTGILHLRDNGLPVDAVTLTAEAATITVSWQEGYRTLIDGREFRQYQDRGQDRHTFQDVQLSLAPDQAVPEVLAMLGTNAQAVAATQGQATVSTIADADVTQVEWSPETQGTEDAPGFWYHVQGPWVHFQGFDQATVQGNLDLFVNNVTLSLTAGQGTAQETWEHWTGYKEADPGAPVTHFETRVTILELRGAELEIRDAPASLMAEQGEVDLDGQVRAGVVVGELTDALHRYTYPEAPLRMHGQGTLALAAAIGGAAQGAIDRQAGHWVTLTPQGDYAVEPTSGMYASPLEAPDAGGTSDWIWMLTGFALVSITATVVLARSHLVRAWDGYRAKRRERNVREWMRTGDRLTGVRDFAKAHTWYAKVTQAYPEVTEAWYAQAVALSELGRHHEAAQAYRRANELLGGDDPEIMDLAALAHFKAGEREAAQALWSELAILDPLRLQRRLGQRPVAGTPVARALARDAGPDEQAVASYA
ncbi:MAG: tetratricopeptide repeat protein [Candidatus Thermoplasmatota archaeon]|nr:tetratricopeptide repeat protein [Candidatus Thermoplasmatota archaeon]